MTVTLLNSTAATNSGVTITPVAHPSSSKVDFGTVCEGADLNDLGEADFKTIERALYEHKVVVIKGQENLDSHKQYDFCCRLDPASSHNRGHDEAEKTHNGKVSLLNGIANKGFADLHPQAVLIGGGTQPARFANRKITQAHHRQWHHSPLTEEESQGGLTRFHRWHMDISLYKAQPPLCTALLCLSVPKMDKPMTVVYGDGSGETMEVAAGSTAFIAGSNAYNILNDEDKALVDNSRVEYPPHPYTWTGAARGNSNGLGVATEGREVPFEDLPPWNEEDIMIYPMVWTCPVTGQKSLQVHPVPVYKMHLKTSPDGPETTLTDLTEIRALLHRLQRPAISPQYVWAPAYSPGDLVIFYNRAVYHSATDFPDGLEPCRTMIQTHVAGSTRPS